MSEPMHNEDCSRSPKDRAPNPSLPLPSEGDVTSWLSRWGYGDAEALNEVFPAVYHELRQVGHRMLARERSDHTLSTTALVHESYLRLLGQDRLNARNREEFFAIAGITMRRILVDHARKKNRYKRGGDAVKIGLEEVVGWLSEAQAEEVEALDEALDRLAEHNSRASLIVHLRFFVGLTCEEVAEVLGLTDRTVRRDWSLARAWLRREIRSNLVED
jgi:RNA polymerase sigma factor (TIGR02999 family)